MKRISGILLPALACVFFAGCEGDEEKNLYKAQDCLNKATSATASGCLGFIASQTSKRSYVLRCSVSFLSEGIDENEIVTALQNIDGKQGGDPTAATISSLAMSTTDAASTALTNCTNSGSSSLKALAGFAQISTIMSTSLLSLGADPTPAQVEAAIDAYSGAPSAANKEALAAAVIASQDSICGADGLLKTTPACTDINNAIAANPNNPTALADALLANLKD